MNLDRFQLLTFDCYGTLIDWESGILGVLRPMAALHGAHPGDEAILEAYARAEASLEGGPYMHYADVLRGCVRSVAAGFGFDATRSEEEHLVESLGDWQPFPDTVAALERLGETRKLAIVSNTDEELIARTLRHLGAPRFAWIVTAERARAYKPSHGVFRLALETFGVDPARVLHVAQSLYHDVAPARELGMASVWVDRRGGRRGGGATLPSDAVPDLKVSSLAELASML